MKYVLTYTIVSKGIHKDTLLSGMCLQYVLQCYKFAKAQL